MFFKKIVFFAIMMQISLSAFAMEADQNAFDLYGDGQLRVVKLPFKYYERKNDDHLTLIHQGGYKVYNIATNTNDVAVIGPLRPCIGIAVTDGVNLVTFHKHCTNSLESMGKILRENLNLSDKDNVYATLYTTKDDIEWKKYNRQPMHGEKTHTQEVVSIKDFLDKNLGITRSNIDAGLQPLRDKNGKLIYADGYLGRYDLAESCVAVQLRDLFDLLGDKKKIKFFSIDPYTEDVFDYKGKEITCSEYLGPKGILAAQEAHPKVDMTAYINNQPSISYDQILNMPPSNTGAKGYEVQRDICERRMNEEEKKFYFNYFGKSQAELFNVDNPSVFGIKYNSLDFYPL